MRFNFKIIISSLVIFLLLLVGFFLLKNNQTLLAGKATLKWNPSTEADFGGYMIYYGENPRTGDCPMGGYENKVDVGKNNQHEISNLKNHKDYYFSVTSYNQSNKESCFSAEVKKTISINYLGEIKNLILRK